MNEMSISRRSFIQTSGAALTASLASKAFAAPRETPVRIGIVGGGFGAGFHWHQDPDCVVAAVSDLRPDRRDHLKNTYGCDTAYDSLEELIKDDSLDAVAVFTEAPNHARHVVAVMDAGMHVISAVPVATSIADCAAVVEAKERNNVRYMMAETSYYRQHTITARRLYEDGVFGEILYCEGEYYHPLIGAEGDSLSYYNGERTWRHGYPPMWYPTHSTGFLVGVTGERLVSVSCLGEGDDDEAFQDNAYNNPFANGCALFKTDRGNIFRCIVMWNAWSHGERAQWFGEKTAYFMPGWAGQPCVLKVEGQPDVTGDPEHYHMVPEAMRYDSGHGGSHPFITHEFIRALMEDREPAVDVYESVAMTAPGLVAHESALQDGIRMDVPSFDP